MVGDAIVPQTKVIPQVDLVITHGGNNTTTESLHFGKPMIVLPLFWDQYDNAQRMDELGFGVRLATYAFTDDELHGRGRPAARRHRAARAGSPTSARPIRARDGLRVGADVIERVGLDHVRRSRLTARGRSTSRSSSPSAGGLSGARPLGRRRHARCSWRCSRATDPSPTASGGRRATPVEVGPASGADRRRPDQRVVDRRRDGGA